jgi:hypothetical protein
MTHFHSEDANAQTPQVSATWLGRSSNEREELVKEALKLFPRLEFISADKSGSITVSFLSPCGANERGTVLLDAEDVLKANIDPALTVWLEPLGDRSSLRRLRGIEVKQA